MNKLKASQIKLRTDFSKRLNIALEQFECPPAQHHGRQEVLETIFSMNYQTIRRWLNGSTMPETCNLAYIADSLGVRLGWLMDGCGKMQK